MPAAMIEFRVRISGLLVRYRFLDSMSKAAVPAGTFSSCAAERSFRRFNRARWRRNLRIASLRSPSKAASRFTNAYQLTSARSLGKKAATKSGRSTITRSRSESRFLLSKADPFWVLREHRSRPSPKPAISHREGSPETVQASRRTSRDIGSGSDHARIGNFHFDDQVSYSKGEAAVTSDGEGNAILNTDAKTDVNTQFW